MIFIDKNIYKNTTGIYCITNTVNNKKYIGLTTVSFNRRCIVHKTRLKTKTHTNKHLLNSSIKYGIEVFKFEVLECIENTNIELLKQRERFYIELFDSYNKGYNQTSGGDYWSFDNVDKSKQIKSVSSPIYQFSKNGEFIYRYNSVSECAKILNVHRDTINNIMGGNNTIFTHSIFKYEKDVDEFDRINCINDKIDVKYLHKNLNKKAVNVLDLNDSLISSFDSISLCAKNFGVAYGTISDCINGRSKVLLKKYHVEYA